MINAGNMPNKNRPYETTNRGLHKSISAYGIVGKLHLEPFIPKRAQVHTIKMKTK